MNLPHDPKAEHACLSAILARGMGGLDDVLAFVREPTDFYIKSHAVIFQAALDCADADDAICQENLVSEMQRRGTYSDAAQKTLESLRSGVITRTRDFAKIVKRDARRRDFFITLRSAAEESLSELDLSKSINKARKALDRLDAEQASLLVPIQVAVEEARQELAKRESGEVSLIPTGYLALDRRGLIEPGDLIVVGAESGTGKTAFAMGCVRNDTLLWVPEGRRYRPHPEPIPSLVISGEMKLTQLVMRWISDMTGFDGQQLKSPSTEWYQAAHEVGTNRDWLEQSFQTLGNTAITLTRPNHVRDTDTACACIRSWAAWMRRKYGQDVPLMVWVDYLQRISAPADVPANARSDEREGAKARAFKNVAQDVNAGVAVLSQITLPSKEAGRRPTGKDLRGSKEIFFEADKVWLLHRPWIWQENVSQQEAVFQRLRALRNRRIRGERDEHGNLISYDEALFNKLLSERSFAEVGIDKGRGGPAHTWLPFEFHPECTRFLDHPDTHESQ